MDVLKQHVNGFSKELTTYWMGLADNTKTGWKESWMSAGQPVVVTTEIPGEAEAIRWEDHPAVTVLPHPTYEGTMPMRDVMGHQSNHGNTVDGITLLTAPANLGVTSGHTVVDVHRQLSRFHAAFRLRMGAK
jgi:hypothetical protein